MQVKEDECDEVEIILENIKKKLEHLKAEVLYNEYASKGKQYSIEASCIDGRTPRRQPGGH